jgi:DNA-binding beta-propeller fold protein YncE
MTEGGTMRNVVKRTAVLAAFGLLSACGSSSTPTQLYGVTVGDTSQLLLLDPTTGALVRTIGPLGYAPSGLAFDPSSGKLYGTTSNNDVNFPDGLIEINMATGAGTPIGTGAGMLINMPAVNSSGQMFAWTEDSDDPVSVNKSTGVATVLGDAGFSSSEQGMAFDKNNVLTFVNGDGEVFTIDTATGAATSLGTIGVRAHHGDFHPGTGKYWGIDETASSATGPARNLLVVDIATLTVTSTLPTADDLHAIAFR